MVAVFVALLLATGPWEAPPVSADERSHSEDEVKAAYLYNFAKFVEWPKEKLPGKDTAIVVGLVCGDAFAEVFGDTVKGKTAKGRAIKLRRAKDVRDLADCHVVFIGASENVRMAEVRAAFKGRSVLTVGEQDGFAARGGMVNLTKEKNKVRFEINPDAAKRASLKMSSQLLKLAKIVRRPGDEEG